MSDEKQIKRTEKAQFRFFKHNHYGTFESAYEVSFNKSIEKQEVNQSLASTQDSADAPSILLQSTKQGIEIAKNALKKACDDYIAFRQNPKPLFSLKDPVQRFNEIYVVLKKSHDGYLESIASATQTYPSINSQEQLELFNTVITSSSVRNNLNKIKNVENDKFDPGNHKKINAFYTYSSSITDGLITEIENNVAAFLKITQPEKISTTSISMSNG